jgi:hypothetical protein
MGATVFLIDLLSARGEEMVLRAMKVVMGMSTAEREITGM